jgi:hypothetical protein
MHRSRHPITIRMAPKAELTSDHFVILPKVGVGVDRPAVSFLPVLLGFAKHGISSTEVLAMRSWEMWLGMVMTVALRSFSYPCRIASG